MVRIILPLFLAASVAATLRSATSFSMQAALPRIAFAPPRAAARSTTSSSPRPTLFAAGGDDLDDEERRFLYGARGEDSDDDSSKGGESKKREQKSTSLSALDAARSAWEGLTSSISKDEEATPAERHREAVAASQAEARLKRGEASTPAERHRAAVAASQARARLRRGEGTPAEKHAEAVAASQARARKDREERQASAKSAWNDITSGLAQSFISTAQAFGRPDENVLKIDANDLPPSKDVDAGQLNKLLVHADRILMESEEAMELLGGLPTCSLPDCKLLSSSPSYIMGVDGSRPTDGIRAFLEVRGPKRSGMATVVGDRRGVLLMKLTVGGQVLELKNTEGLDEAAASGVKKGGLKP